MINIVTSTQVEHPPPNWPALGRVDFLNLTASYAWDAPKPALRGLSVTIAGGSSCAFVGRSGSGKSTTVLALAGMIPIVKGRLELDGLDIRAVPMLVLRGTMAVVLQVCTLVTSNSFSNHVCIPLLSALRFIVSSATLLLESVGACDSSWQSTP